MNIDDVLDADWEAVGMLRDPVLVVALRGWFDVAELPLEPLSGAFRIERSPSSPISTLIRSLTSPGASGDIPRR